MGFFGDTNHDSQRRVVQMPSLRTSLDSTTTTSQQDNRSRPTENVVHDKPKRQSSRHATPTHDVNAEKTKRRASKLGLFGLFSRAKPLEVETPQERLSVQFEGDEEAEQSHTGAPEVPYDNGGISFPQDLDLSATQENAALALRHRASKGALKTKTSFRRERSIRAPTVWDPPPLFQAYPQSVKHATLRVPAVSAETILRLHNDGKGQNVKQRANPYSGNTGSSGGEKMEQKEKRLKRATPSEVVSKGEWVEKLYVLVTSGYVLQYAGHGAFDRLPEKIMPLSKDSAAFASDVIPGKHFVLQISQVSDEDGKIDSEASRSMFRKFGVRGDARRSTSSILLVLETPEEMGDWLVAVRKEIEAMGGKQYRPDESLRLTREVAAPRLQQRPSQRYLVKRDPHQFSERAWEPPPDVSLGDSISKEDKSHETAKTPTSSIRQRQSLTTQRSTDSHYISDTTASIDQIHLDRLRESHRQSYASTGGRTISTSRGSSPGRSPNNAKPLSMPESRIKFSATASTYPGAVPMSTQRVPESATSDRESLQATPTPSSRPISMAISPPGRTPSPAGPNFSVPNYSKRYSTASSSPGPSTVARSTPVTVVHESLPPSLSSEEGNDKDERMSTVGELQPRAHSGSRASRRVSSSERGSHLITPPSSSHSHEAPSSPEGERSYSRRFSSLEYARGISPIQLAKSSPAPHPPPTTALPAIPDGVFLKRASVVPPPTVHLPTIPAAELSSQGSLGPPPTIALPAIPVEDTFSSVTLNEHPRQASKRADPTQGRKLRRPISMQVRSGPPAKDSSQLQAVRKIRIGDDYNPLPPPTVSSPPKPNREPPPPPSASKVQPAKVTSRRGREPPPVYPSPNPKSRPSIPDPATKAQTTAAPHAFIPPIRVSERKSQGSLDGPWRENYGAPKRTFLDLSAG